MWYEILINGYSWFTTQSHYTSNIKIAQTIGGEQSEGYYTRNEASQMRDQFDDYNRLGYNQRLKHLDRTGITK